VEGLREQGFVVVEAADGASGLEVLDRERPNALVVDFAMQGMTGAEVARRARAARPLLPILFCSGFADSLALDDVPGARVLRKPIAINTLGNSVREALAAH
jgi:CheY-like chemotaxis protein